MDENYYDILEINKNASSEIIEKAYKTLVKKYHPDLQSANQKAKYEEKIKLINEAYEILSDPIKKENYDSSLKQEDALKQNLYEENMHLRNELNNLKNNNYYNNSQQANNTYTQDNSNTNNPPSSYYEEQIKNQEQINNAVHQAYHDAYIRDLKNRGYKIRYQKTPKEIFKNILALIITLFIFVSVGFILWIIPPSRNYLINMYNNNYILKFLVDIILNLFNLK